MDGYAAAILVPNKQLQDTTLSFIGGAPTKGENSWPLNPEKPDDPLHLIVQLSCEDILRTVPSSPLPNHGVLQFFFDTENFVDSEDRPTCRVVWQSSPEPKETLPSPKRLKTVGGEMWSYMFGKAKSEVEVPRQLPQTSLEFQPIETTPERAIQDVATRRGIDLSDFQSNRIGPWNFWHQALGELPPDMGGGPLSRDPKVVDHILLLRLVCDENHGLDWDGHHNPSLTFWISEADLIANRWDQAYGLFTDF
ncbi:DUF1963 domain-containing protein [Ascidiaceihabitans sp.]|uniref:DUF1963 domain-containing protein n=1 Tax=Ascidiaceihabitans sp. TaxID=1872644 RepID=UPI0032969559